MTTNALTPQLVREQIARLFVAINERDIPKILEFFTDDVVWTQPIDGRVVGSAEAGKLLEGMFRTMPDLHFPLEDQRVYVSEDGRTAVSTWRMVGTMTGVADPPGYQPTGKSAAVPGSCVYELRDGKISRHTIVYDGLDLLQQLGLLPAVNSLPVKIMAGAQSVTTKLVHALHSR